MTKAPVSQAAGSKALAKSAQRNLGLGYATPIVGGVVALLLGLIIVDITHTNLDIWIWVLIQFILGTGLVLGTRFATAAYNFSLTSAKRVGATRGARNLNLVLGIIWSAIVTIMAFVKGSDAVQRMVIYPRYAPVKDGSAPTPTPPHVEPFNATAMWQNFVPAFVLIVLAVVGIYLLLAERSREAK